MAHITPAGWREVAATGAALREIETLNRLAHGLSDEYSVYHGVHWTNVDKGFSAYGEIDFIVLAPNGRILLIEQKSGFLDETPEGLVKKYPGKDKLIHTQILRTIHGLMTRFNRSGEHLSIDYLLYCPDYRVKHPQTAGIDATRIVDASSDEQLISIIARLLPLGETAPLRKKVARVLSDTLRLTRGRHGRQR
jgi:hypothetical protein